MRGGAILQCHRCFRVECGRPFVHESDTAKLLDLRCMLARFSSASRGREVARRLRTILGANGRCRSTPRGGGLWLLMTLQDAR